ncbi:MAG: hypothetical protein KDA61_14660 [Planctomycetales bacterium]|nr:hypothetical protein [Planctomycetales bacterium]
MHHLGHSRSFLCSNKTIYAVLLLLTSPTSSRANFHIILRENATFIDGNGQYANLISPPTLTESGRVVLPVQLRNTQNGSLDDSALVAYSPASGVRSLVREGASERNFSGTPSGTGQFGDLRLHRLDRHFIVGENGDVAFIADLRNTPAGSTDDSGLYRAYANSVQRIAREDEQLNRGTGEFDYFSTAQFTAYATSINAAGDLAFEARTRNSSPSSNDEMVFYSRPGQAPRIVARESDGIGGGQTFDSFSSVHINENRQITFWAELNNSPADGGVFRVNAQGATPAAPVALFREGSIMPGRGYAVVSVHPGLKYNASGAFAFEADSETSFGPDVLAAYVNGTLREVARFGSTPPGGNGAFNNDFELLALNNASQAIFHGQVDGSAAGGVDDDGVYLWDSGSLRKVVRENDFAPGGNGRFDEIRFDTLAAADRDYVAFTSTLRVTTGAATGVDDDEGAFLYGGGTLRRLAQEAQRLPTGDYVTHVYEDLAVNNWGEALFQIRLSATSANAFGTDALFLFNEGKSRELLRVGDAVDGRTITAIHQDFSLNDLGQIVVSAETGGSDQLVLFLNPNADFNDNGHVGGSDFIAWQSHFGKEFQATHRMGDADCDGDVDERDFRFWNEQFGSRGGTFVATAIPEPTALILGGCAVCGCARRRRR